MSEQERQTQPLGDTIRRLESSAPAHPRAGEILLGRFQLVRLLGRGGMGEVFEARDLRLHTTVALKTVGAGPASATELLERLRREVQLARTVTHPNVCRVFDFHEGSGPDGLPQAFVTMEYLEGETLAERLRSGPLAPAAAVPLLAEMAEGLAACHARGLVHRDFKPSNVMLVPEEGRLRSVVTDFGIARVAGNRGGDSEWAGTQHGMVIGSPAYMAPEQRAGQEVTARTDIHALALVACEMVSGHLPGEGGALEGIPRRWVPSLRQGLALDPLKRPDDARTLVRRLSAPSTSGRRLGIAAVLAVSLLGAAASLWLRRGASPSADRRTIALLPLASVGGSSDDAYLAQGLAEDILSQLSRVRGLQVIARSSTQGLQGTHRSLRELGEELGAGAFLEGSVRHAEGKVRINARLIDARTERQLWAETYDRDAHHVLDIQSDVAAKVAAALAFNLTQVEAARSRRGATSNPEAYDAYLRGVSKVDAFWEGPSVLEAIADFQRAIELDPRYALAHAQLGAARVQYGLFVDPDAPGWSEQAHASLNRALELEAELALPHATLGQLHFSRPGGWNVEAAMREFARARELEPDSVHLLLGRVLIHLGLEEPAEREEAMNLKLNPGSQLAKDELVSVFWANGRYAEADARARALNADKAGWLLYYAPLHDGRIGDALNSVYAPGPDGQFLPDPPASATALTLAVAGRREEAGFLLRLFDEGYPLPRLEHAHHFMFELACAHAVLGHPLNAVAWLRRAAAAGFPNYLLFSREPFLDPIRADPAFVAFMAELKPRWERWKADYR